MDKTKQKMEQVRIFITDSEAVYRKGLLWALLEDDTFEVIGEASTNIETLERIVKTPADILILNANHNKPSGIDVTRYVNHRLPNAKVILMMDEYRTEYIVEGIKSGAKACISKSIDLDSLLRTMHQVINDELPISNLLTRPEVADSILREYEVSAQTNKDTNKAHIGLVKSEQMILKKISHNVTLSDVTTSLGISEGILAEYLDEIVEKLVKIEHYNETPKQRYISNLISRSIDEPSGGKYLHLDDQSSRFHSGVTESNIPDKLPSDIRARTNAEKIETNNQIKQSSEHNEPVREISEILDLAAKTEKNPSVNQFNQNIMNITKDLVSEINHRKQIIRRIKNAIEFEVEYMKDLDSTWN